MTDDELLDELRNLRRVSMAGDYARPGFALVVKPDDLALSVRLDEYVARQGGREVVIPSPKSKSVGGGRTWKKAPPPPTRTYEVPATLLEP